MATSNIGLGSLVKGGLADPLVAPETAPNPVEIAALGSTGKAVQAGTPQTQDPATAERTFQWKQALQDPRIKAGFLQMGVNLLAGQSLGSAAGGGLAAVGRAGQAETEAELAAAEEARKQEELQLKKDAFKASRARKTSSPSDKIDKRREVWLKRLAEQDKLQASNLDYVPPSLADRYQLADTLAWIEERKGDPAAFLQMYQQNPEAAMNAFAQASKATSETSSADTTTAPTQKESSSPTPTPTTPDPTPTAPVVDDPLTQIDEAQVAADSKAKAKAAAEEAARIEAETAAANKAAEKAAVGNVQGTARAALAKKVAPIGKGLQDAQLSGVTTPVLIQTLRNQKLSYTELEGLLLMYPNLSIVINEVLGEL